ncbi:MAG: type II toxin-antitoxin system HipA family toxin [Alphaproteobacteria bacterium]|nr:type II toxin-antitoxin system HipA family toxin [Alphaproteobacteria bacterium]
MVLRSAEVQFKGLKAGILSETMTGGTSFIYDSAWTKDIGCCLPVKKTEHFWPQGLHPFFENLGPEGWLREEQARTAHIAEEDDFGLLLRYGSDCIGAISIIPVEKLSSKDSVFDENINPGRTISGVQRKLLVVDAQKKGDFSPALATGPAPYIAKLNSTIKDLVMNEFLSLRWTSAVLGANEVTEFSLGDISKLNESALIIKRFDRTPKGEKLRLEDFSQILCRPKGRDYSGKYNASYEEVAKVILDHSVRPIIDLAKFYRRLIIFSLIGNADGHLKNFSLLETNEGLRLSPVYDVLNTAIYQSYNQNLALSIRGKKVHIEQVDSKLLYDFGQDIGLSRVIIEQTFDDLKRQVQKAAPIIRPLEMEDVGSFRSRFEEVVRNACLRIFKN